MSINKHDRCFDKAKASPVGPVFALNLESISFALYCLEVYGLEYPPVPNVIPTGGILDRYPEEPARIESPGLTDALPYDTPMACSTTVHIAAAYDYIRGLKKREKVWQVRRIVGEVSIHLDDSMIASSQSPLKASDVGGTEAQLAGTGYKMYLGPILVLHKQNLVLRTVLAMVIHKQDVNSGNCL
jgi:hypothetical protein